MVALNQNYIDGSSRLSLYSLNSLTLAYVDHWWSELSDYQFGAFKRIVLGGEPVFYLGYITSQNAPYTGRSSGGIMRLNYTLQCERDMLYGMDRT